MKASLRAQFHRPHGLLGQLAGWIMARRASNQERNRWTVALLNLRPTDRVLELGPGPGVTLGQILERVPNGEVVAVDHSATMLGQSRRANRRAIRSGRLQLIQGSFTDLPRLPGPFDAIVAVNSLQFDAMEPATLCRLAAELAPDGTLAVTLQPRGAHANRQAALAFADRMVALLGDAGLTSSRIEVLPLEPAPAVCVLARRIMTRRARPSIRRPSGIDLAPNTADRSDPRPRYSASTAIRQR